jgi:hypothetical protein
VLLVWSAALFASARSGNRTLVLELLPRKQHWMQACAQGTVLLYWGWTTRAVYAWLPFVLAQLLFAYGFDSLLSFSRRGRYTLGFGPFPVIFSINLFLWFRLEWFHWQLAMVALGFLAKELVRWNREGKPAHIFNPSSFPLAIVSVVLIATAGSGTTFGELIANTQFDPPGIYALIFLVALPGQILFGVARMTLAAVVTLYAISHVYLAATGTYLFYDADIPIAVFLGMHLLFTDPSTSPRSELGRLAFGALYGCGTAVCFVLLSRAGIPTFYDKLLPVPVMNLMVRAIDRVAASPALAALDPGRLVRSLTPTRRNAAWVGVWAAVFAVLTATNGLGDHHPGQYLPFWDRACSAGSERACTYRWNLTLIYCNNGSGWACNEVCARHLELREPAQDAFRRGCELGFSPACDNADHAAAGAAPPARDRPALRDLPIVLRGTKPALLERDAGRLNAIACRQGWPGTCAALPG